jgi:hypothetical protein
VQAFLLADGGKSLLQRAGSGGKPATAKEKKKEPLRVRLEALWVHHLVQGWPHPTPRSAFGRATVREVLRLELLP